MRCRICRKSCLLERGYCFECTVHAKEVINRSRAVLSGLGKACENGVPPEKRNDYIETAKRASLELKRYYGTPFCDWNFKEETRSILYMLGATKRDYRDILGYREETSYLAQVLACSCFVFWLVFAIIQAAQSPIL